jgi:hypothetical protein
MDSSMFKVKLQQEMEDGVITKTSILVDNIDGWSIRILKLEEAKAIAEYVTKHPEIFN